MAGRRNPQSDIGLPALGLPVCGYLIGQHYQHDEDKHED
jgi:hypothetical protein